MSIEKKPLVNDLYTADPSAHVFNGKIYIYPSHDEDIDVENIEKFISFFKYFIILWID